MPAQPAAPDLDRSADLDSLTLVPDICDVTLPLRLLLLRGVSFALATVVGAQGVAVDPRGFRLRRHRAGSRGRVAQLGRAAPVRHR